MTAASRFDYALFDADNHYFEPRDCFTRHIEARYADKAIRSVRDADGTEYLVFGEQRLYFPPIKFDELDVPGSMMETLKQPESATGGRRPIIPMHPAYQDDRHARLAMMDEQGVESILMFPSVGVSWQHETCHDPEGTYANIRAFNRWVQEDWGFGADGRIFAAPSLSLIDLDSAVTELDRVLEAGARIVYMRPAPVGGRSLADTLFDPFWARLNEARVPVAFHLGAGDWEAAAKWGENPQPHADGMSAMQMAFFFSDRPIMETLGALILHNLFGRFPNLRVASIENGSQWVPYFLTMLKKGWLMGRFGPWPGGQLDRRPTEIFREHVWVAPYPEEDNAGLARLIGASQVLFGSDFPHPEGEAEPADFVHTLEGLDDTDIRKIMRENCRLLLNLS